MCKQTFAGDGGPDTVGVEKGAETRESKGSQNTPGFRNCSSQSCSSDGYRPKVYICVLGTLLMCTVFPVRMQILYSLSLV